MAVNNELCFKNLKFANYYQFQRLTDIYILMNRLLIGKAFLLGLIVALPAGLSAQNIDEIKSSGEYLYAEGHGRTVNAADKDALQNLISQISISVESEFSSVQEEVNSNDEFDYTSAVKSVVNLSEK